MKSLIFTIIFVYLLLCIVLFFFQRKLLYYPTPVANIPNEKEIVFDVNGTKLYGWVLNEGKQKALIYYGGNAESIELNIDFFNRHLSEYTIYLINYRGYGKSQGSPSQNNLVNDASIIYDKVKQNHNSISIIGRSLGTGVATLIASSKQIDKLVLVSPYDSIENIASDLYSFFPVSFLLRDKFKSYENTSNIKAKILILYSKNDEVVKAKYTENLLKYFDKDKLKVVEINEAHHNNLETFDEYIDNIEEFFK